MTYKPSSNRYQKMIYNRSGKSGLKLPAISLGLWQNFAQEDGYDRPRELIQTAFDRGVTHFDLANNYGDGNAEKIFGEIIRQDFSAYRDEMIISTKAGYYMWPGPYGDWGSRKSMLASLDQSLQRLGLDYVDIYYSHRQDPDTPLEETAIALDTAVKQGKTLYVGMSNYSAAATKEMSRIFKELRTPFIIHQPAYSMYNRQPEEELFPLLEEEGIGAIVFSPLAQGLLTDRYKQGIPSDSRAARESSFLSQDEVTEERIKKAQKLGEIAQSRGQTLAQLALAWVLNQTAVVSALVGASKPEQLIENIDTIQNLSFAEEELQSIENIINQ